MKISNIRASVLFASLLVLSTAYGARTWWQHSASSQRQAEFVARLDDDARALQQAESAQIASGEVWVGELHGPTESDVDSSSLAASSTPFQSQAMDSAIRQYIGGMTKFADGGLSAQTSIHECHPGSPLCSTGGDILISLGSRTVCTVSVLMLQPSMAGLPASQFRLAWHVDSHGNPLSFEEKMNIVHQLATDVDSRDVAEFHRLLRSLYDMDHDSADNDQQEILQSLVGTIFRAIEESQAT